MGTRRELCHRDLRALSALCVTLIGVAIWGAYRPEAMRHYAKPGLEAV